MGQNLKRLRNEQFKDCGLNGRDWDLLEVTSMYSQASGHTRCISVLNRGCWVFKKFPGLGCVRKCERCI